MDKNDINNTESTLPGTLRGAIEAVVLIVDTPITTCDLARAVAVSYTHLTLPTICSV